MLRSEFSVRGKEVLVKTTLQEKLSELILYSFITSYRWDPDETVGGKCQM